MASLNINSSLTNVTKDINEIFSRLFDHHPFVSGEINFFLKEFEGKRKENDVEGLFRILDRVVDSRETLLDKAVSLADPDLQTVKNNCTKLHKIRAYTFLKPFLFHIILIVEKSLRNCDKILNMENLDEAEAAAERRLSLQREWEEFEKDNTKKQQEVTNLFNEKEQEIRSYYLELEKKLHIDK